MDESNEKVEINYVHKEKTWAQTIANELKHQKLYTQFTLNPFNEVFVYPEKPNVKPQVGAVDEELYKIIERSRLEPKLVYAEPLSVNHEYGWISTPLFSRSRNDRRFNFGKNSCEMTRFMSSYWQQKSAMKDNMKAAEQNAK